MCQHCRITFPELQIEDGPETHEDGVEDGQIVVEVALDLHHPARVTEGPEVTGIADWTHGDVLHPTRADVHGGDVEISPTKKDSILVVDVSKGKPTKFRPKDKTKQSE